MTEGEELANVLAEIGWTATDLSQQIDVSRYSVYNWLKDRNKVPGPVKAYLNLVLQVRAVGFLVGHGRSSGRQKARDKGRPLPDQTVGQA